MIKAADDRLESGQAIGYDCQGRKIVPLHKERMSLYRSLLMYGSV